MAVPWAVIGAGAGVFSAASGLFSAGAAKHQAQVSSKIGATQRRTSGEREISNLKLGMTLSGVEVSEPGVAAGSPETSQGFGASSNMGASGAAGVAGGSQGIRYDPGKKGFLGIGKKEGGAIIGGRDYSTATDTASLILGTSRDAISLDVSAIEINAANAAFAFSMEAFSAGLDTFAAGLMLGKTIKDYNPDFNDQGFLAP